MLYDGKTYLPNMVKLSELPEKIKHLFLEPKKGITQYHQDIDDIEDTTPPKKMDRNLNNLSSILFEQLQNIVDPEDNIDVKEEIKKANTVCNIADKIISIADLSLKSEMLQERKNRKFKSLYR